MAASNQAPADAPPGSVASSSGPHPGLPLSRFWCAGFGLVLAALEEGIVRQPAAYLLPGTLPSLELIRAFALGCSVAGGYLGFRQSSGFRGLSWGSGLLSAALSVAGAAWFWSFGAGRAAQFACLAPLAIAGSAGFVLGSALRTLGSVARSLEVLRYAIHPFRILLALGLLVGSAGLAGRLGLWRSAAVLGVCVAGLGSYLPMLQRYLYGHLPSRRAFALSGCGVVLGVASLCAAHDSLPSDALGRYPGDIVFSSRGPGQYVVSSVQQSFEVYRGSVLRLASVDAKRYAECLVQPALALAAQRSRVLILGSADGLAEREVLAYSDVVRVTTLTDDPSLANLAKSNAFFRDLSADSLRSARLTLLVGEALVWLSTHSERFDVIVVDLPDPSDFIQAKNYTHYFYQQLRAHLTPGGLFVTQATSSAASPASFSSIAASVESAGFRVKSYAAPIPTLGEWGFVLGSMDALPPPDSISLSARQVLGRTSYVDARRLALLLSTPLTPDPLAPANTLSEQPIVELLNSERRARGL